MQMSTAEKLSSCRVFVTGSPILLHIRYRRLYVAFIIGCPIRGCTLIVLILILNFRENLSEIVLIWLWVYGKSPAEIFSHIKEHLNCEMVSFECALRRTTEACLASIWVDQLKFFPHDHTSCRFFCFMNGEWWSAKAEIVTYLIEHHWKYLLF